MDWNELKKYTQARIAIGRAGHAIPTLANLEFQAAHAAARDAIHKTWHYEKLAESFTQQGLHVLKAQTQVRDRSEYLKRPDLGRCLTQESQEHLVRHRSPCEIVIVLSDGLSAQTIDRHGQEFVTLLVKELKEKNIIPPIVIAPFSRVGLSDEIGTALATKLVLMVIGERPGLSSVDSLAVYLTFNPKRGNSDVNRNCISNIRPPLGLSYEQGIEKTLYLTFEALRRQYSGVMLKDETAMNLLP